MNMKKITTKKIQRLMFPDGTILQATDARCLLESWRSKQWHGPDEANWRDELAKRAYIWSGTNVDPTLRPASFIRALERAGLVKVIEGGK
jgi:hypothetical protein